jgi:MFS family permease
MVLITFLLGAFFIVIESRSSEPMVNLRLFKNLTFTLANISALLNFMSQYVLVFLTPFYLHGVLNYTPYDTGLIMVSFPLSVLVIAPISGSLSDKIGTKKLACFGTALCSVSLFSMSQLSSSFTPSDLIWRLALFGLGTGIFQSPNTSAAMGSVPPSYLGIASGILATIRNAGMLLGIATAAMVLYAFVPSDVLQMSTFNPSEILAFLSGLKSAYVMGGIFAGIAVLTSLVSPHD